MSLEGSNAGGKGEDYERRRDDAYGFMLMFYDVLMDGGELEERGRYLGK